MLNNLARAYVTRGTFARGPESILALPRQVRSVRGSPFGGQSLVPGPLALPGHVLGAKIVLGRERVVGGAVQGQVGGGVLSQLTEGVSVVQLQPVCFTAAFTAIVDKMQ
jgi:hypothetical protein